MSASPEEYTVTLIVIFVGCMYASAQGYYDETWGFLGFIVGCYGGLAVFGDIGGLAFWIGIAAGIICFRFHDFFRRRRLQATVDQRIHFHVSEAVRRGKVQAVLEHIDLWANDQIEEYYERTRNGRNEQK